MTRAVNLDDAAAGITSHAQRVVQTDGAGGDDLDVLNVVVAQLHDGTAAEGLADFIHCYLQGLELLGRNLFALRLIVLLVDNVFCHKNSSG